MIDRKPELGVGRQAKALGISRGSVYYAPRPTSDADLALMRRTCERPLDYPFAGSRMLKGLVQAEGHSVGRLHVSTLMKKMAIAALYRRPNTSKPAPGHKVCPYLLRNLAATRPIPASGRCQVWAIPGLGDGHRLHSDGPRLRLSGRRRRLVQPQGPGLAAVDHAVGGFLRRGAGRGARLPWPARDLQQRSGLASHQRRLHQGPEG